MTLEVFSTKTTTTKTGHAGKMKILLGDAPECPVGATSSRHACAVLPGY